MHVYWILCGFVLCKRQSGFCNFYIDRVFRPKGRSVWGREFCTSLQIEGGSVAGILPAFTDVDEKRLSVMRWQTSDPSRKLPIQGYLGSVWL